MTCVEPRKVVYCYTGNRHKNLSTPPPPPPTPNHPTCYVIQAGRWGWGGGAGWLVYEYGYRKMNSYTLEHVLYHPNGISKNHGHGTRLFFWFSFFKVGPNDSHGQCNAVANGETRIRR